MTKKQSYDPITYANIGIPVVGTLLAKYRFELGRDLTARLDMTEDELETISLAGDAGFTPITLTQQDIKNKVPNVLRADENKAPQLWFRVPLALLGRFVQKFYNTWWFSQQGRNWTIALDNKRAPVIQPTIMKLTDWRKEVDTVVFSTDLYCPKADYDHTATPDVFLDFACREVKSLGISPAAVKLLPYRKIESPETGAYLDGYGLEISGPFGNNVPGYRIRSAEKLLTWGLGRFRLYGCGVFFVST